MRNTNLILKMTPLELESFEIWLTNLCSTCACPKTKVVLKKGNPIPELWAAFCATWLALSTCYLVDGNLGKVGNSNFGANAHFFFPEQPASTSTPCRMESVWTKNTYLLHSCPMVNPGD